MDLFNIFAAFVDRLDPDIVGLLAYFSDERIPLRLSIGIVAVAVALLALLVAWGTAVRWRIYRLRRVVRSCGTGCEFKKNFEKTDSALSRSIFASAWHAYRSCLKEGAEGILCPRPPGAYFALEALPNACYPARFFATLHGYFTGVGLLLTFVGLVAALKFAAAGVASPELAVAKEALKALLAAASFKFMTSIAGLGCSLLLSMASRVTNYTIENAARGLADDLERGLTPIFSESLAYDQFLATRAQLILLEKIGANLAAATETRAAVPPRADERAERSEADHSATEAMLKDFLAEIRGTASDEMKQLAAKLSEVGAAIGGMQRHIDKSGQGFADQLSLAGSRLLKAATALQESVDGRVHKVGDRIDALGESFAKGEAMVAAAANKAARGMAQSMKDIGDEIALGVLQATKGLVATSDGLAQRFAGMLGGFDHFNDRLDAQVKSMGAIAASLDGVKQALDQSAGIWQRAATPVIASVDASQRVAAELRQVADRVSTTQLEMTEMAKAVSQLSDKASTVWDNYRGRFEKVDQDLQAVFERLQGGTRAFGKEVMDFVGALDANLAEGMQALSVGTEELRKVAEILVFDSQAKAA